MIGDEDHVYRGPSTITGSSLMRTCGVCVDESHTPQCPTVLIAGEQERPCACALDWGHVGEHEAALYETETEEIVLQDSAPRIPIAI